jgi:hypothetical protein
MVHGGPGAARGTVTVVVVAVAGVVRVEGSGRSGRTVPVLRAAGRDAEGGRGLQLVGAWRRGGGGFGGRALKLDKGQRSVEDWSLLNAQCRAPGPRFWVIPWYYGGSQVGSVVGRLARSCWLASVA